MERQGVYCKNRVKQFGFSWEISCDAYIPWDKNECPRCGAPNPQADALEGAPVQQQDVSLDTDWNRRGVELAAHIATWSKDKSRGVACVILGEGLEPLSFGYNGFPRGVNDNVPERHERPLKYKWTIHDAANAICNAARVGTALKGSTLYTNTFPCSGCAGLIVQAGIYHVVTRSEVSSAPGWKEDKLVAEEILSEARVHVTIVEN